MKERRGSIDALLLALLGVVMLVNLYLIFFHAPVERTMGLVQKIFYFHVPSAWIAFLAFFVVFIGSAGYLITGRDGYDRTARCSAGIGVLFCSLVLLTGPLWAKPVWGIWWTWDPRLTSTLVLWFLYVGYLLLRSYLPEGPRRATLSAILGIIGFLDVPIVYASIRWWRNQHPSPVIGGGSDSGLDPRMKLTFFFSLFAFTLLYVVLLRLRTRYARSEEGARSILEERKRTL